MATARVAELEAALAEHVDATGVRARELDRTLGNLRKEAREASNACRAAEGELARVVGERDALRERANELAGECDRLRSDSEQLRAHAAVLGDELAAARTAPRAEARDLSSRLLTEATAPPVEAITEPVVAEPVVAEPAVEGPPPLPLRIAGRHAPAPPLAKRRPRSESARSTPASSAPALAALARREPPPEPLPVAEVAPEPIEPGAEPEPPTPVADNRRTALAAFTSLAASGGDDFTYRRR